MQLDIEPRSTPMVEGGTANEPRGGYATPPPAASRFTFERVIRFLFITTVVVVVAWLLWYFLRLVIFLMVGVVLAYLMRPLMYRLQGMGLGHIPAIILTFVGFFGAVSIALTSLLPFLGAQISEVTQQISPDGIATAISRFASQFASQWLPLEEVAIKDDITRLFNTLFQEDSLTQVMGSVVDIFTNLFYAVLVIPFVTFFFLKDGNHIRHTILSVVPNRYFEITLAILEKVESSIGRYFRALAVQCTSIAIVASILLYIIGLEYAVAVGLFTGLANSIPYFGPIIGFMAGTLVGISQTGDFSLLPGVIFAMGLTQVSDNVFFQPLIFSRAAESHPLVILLAVLIGSQLAGIVGMLIAIPVLTTLRVTFKQVRWSTKNYRILKATR